jgi:hypothetical protein
LDTHAGWNEYENVLRGIAFRYPPSGVWMDDQTMDVESVAAFDLGTQATSTTAISVPTTALYVRVLSQDDVRLKGCFFSEAGWSEERIGVTTATRSLGGREVCIASEQDAAAGNRYASYAYATRRGSEVIILNFVVHSVNCENYSNPSVDCVAFDEERDTRGFDDIVSTLRFTDPAPGVRIDPALFKEKLMQKKTRFYELNVSSPHLEGFDDAQTEAVFNRLIAERVQARIDGFLKDAAEYADEGTATGDPWMLYEDFTVYPAPYGRVSIVMRGSEYTGGVHPNSYEDTMIFDLKTRSVLTPEQLFRPGTDYVKLLSDVSLAELRRRNGVMEFSDEDWLQTGAGPDAENFKTVYLTDAGLVIIFSAYQVAPYVAGTSEVLVPYRTLQGVLVL